MDIRKRLKVEEVIVTANKKAGNIAGNNEHFCQLKLLEGITDFCAQLLDEIRLILLIEKEIASSMSLITSLMGLFEMLRNTLCSNAIGGY